MGEKSKTRPETRDRDRESGEMQRSHHKETMRLTMCNDLYLVRHLKKCVPKRDDGTCLIVFEKHVLRMASVGKSGKRVSAYVCVYIYIVYIYIYIHTHYIYIYIYIYILCVCVYIYISHATDTFDLSFRCFLVTC